MLLGTTKLLKGLLLLLPATVVAASLFGSDSSLLRGTSTEETKNELSPLQRLLVGFTFPGDANGPTTTNASPVKAANRLGTGCGAPFTCSDGGICTQWISDGINTCTCGLDGTQACTQAENGCSPGSPCTLPDPVCIDNNSCLPSSETPPPPAETRDTTLPPVPVAPPTTESPTVSPRTQHPEISEQDSAQEGKPMLEQVAELLRQGEEQVAPLLGANSTYQVEDFISALEMSYDWETSASQKKSLGIVDRQRRQLQETPRTMDLGGEMASANGTLQVAMAHLAVLLGQAWHAGLQTGMCDEPNDNATDTENPGCGQNGLNYRFPFDGFQEEGFGCFANEQEWENGVPAGCAVQPPVELIQSDAKEPSRQMTCGLSVESITSRDCCWWGRGMLQMTHQCDYGDYQSKWGSQQPAEQRPPTDLCANPGQVCDDDFPELRFLTGLYLWVRDVVHAEDPSFDFIKELQEWVDSKMDMRENGNFVDRVGGVLLYGDPELLPTDYRERRYTVQAALDTLMSLAPVNENLSYGNVALCKPATQSTIAQEQVASHAVDGIIDSPNISHTECEENPWWHVELESPHQIYTIAIVNRQDCCFDRLDHVKIELFDEDGNPIEQNNTIQHDPNTEGHIVNVWTVDFETPPIVSEIKVSLSAAPGECKFLNMAEVQVFGYCQFGDACLTGQPCGLENVAQCKPTSQSSTANDESVSFVAVDSLAFSTEEELAAGEGVPAATTQCEESPYWEVDLKSRHNVSMVAVFIPGDSSSMNGLLVELVDGETGEVVTSKQHDPSTGPIGNVAIFGMENDMVEYLSSVVRVRLPGSGGGCSTLKLAEVQVFSECWDGASCVTWPSCAYENVAECKAATQSSTFEGGVAWRAIDGHQALSHTKCEEEPWWEVDLLDDYAISEVILYNREDCCFDRLNSVVIELKDVLGETVQSMQHEPEKEGVIEDSWTVNFNGAIARRVRVTVQHEPDECGYLNIRDIQVMRTCLPGEDCHSWSGCETGNVAQCKPATQSSTFFGDVAAQGVDGDESLAHTDCELNPWWGVNLLETRTVSHVVVHNREDCCYERLNGLKVQLLDEANQPLSIIQHSLEQEGLINFMWIATFEPPVENVKSVFLSTEHPEGFCEFLNLAEVEVMSACLDGDSCQTGFGCDKGNVAMCKPARQSTTLTTRLNNETIIEAGVAGRAVDGHDYLSHTECETNPWWEVDLMGMREISEVIVHNRQDDFFERLNGILVELLDDSGSVVASAQHDPNTEGLIHFSWLHKFDEIPASRVRISKSYAEGCDYLNLADVEVLSACEEGDACLTISDCVHGNVAQCKPARQISTKEGFVASNAVNGTGTRLAHTECEEKPWWEVDLLDDYPVSEVIVFNRLDGYQDRLNGILVELLDANGTTIAEMQHDPSADGVIRDDWSADFNQIDFFIARKVRLSISNPPGSCEFLNLADVQVMSICREGDACLKGESCTDGNVAQCKLSEQSSTLDGAVAIKATDGEETLSMTECEPEPWWMVDLETRRDVSEVVLFNRRDCCFEQLNGVLVELMDSFGNLLNSAQHDVEEDGIINSVWSAKFEEENVRYVKVSTKHFNGTCAPLELAEVQVMSRCEEEDACKTGRNCENVPLVELPKEDVPTEDKE
ncbi:F5/8 type C domain [Seminavis robusta]|uniref:F5/8 type C domain n=1 Tax=Seminavis robusta TaxID=568900 RepID=A0A9N8EXM2_9STRA|nr:F5/8 type C domain [Seminavis robusta]|eukprot:Sro2286_g322000.1 F5/8 type C domain (1631) ;mRNA; r:3374-8438